MKIAFEAPATVLVVVDALFFLTKVRGIKVPASRPGTPGQAIHKSPLNWEWQGPALRSTPHRS